MSEAMSGFFSIQGKRLWFLLKFYEARNSECTMCKTILQYKYCQKKKKIERRK